MTRQNESDTTTPRTVATLSVDPHLAPPVQQAAQPRFEILSENDPGNPFQKIGGSVSRAFNSVLFRETLATAWFPGGDPEGTQRRTEAVAHALATFKPKDEIDSMLAAQAVAMHFGAMECFRRAMLADQPFEIATKLRKDGANLARGMTDMLEALDRKRGKGPQVVRVERVVVHDGGQAIVGNVAPAASRGEA